MHKKVIDLIGKRFGRLTVLEIASKDKWGHYKWLCKCDCGNSIIVRGDNLKSNITASCGCLNKDLVKKRMTIHGKVKSVEYKCWSGIKARCLNENYPKYKNYGGRGITVCERWLKFENFYKDMGERQERLSLDRIDNNKGYCKENCRWATYTQQNRNKRNNKMITYKGETMCVIEWAEKLDIKYNTLLSRLYKRWSIEKTFTY